MIARLWVLAASIGHLAGGCAQPRSVECGARICSPGYTCAPDGLTCATPPQLAACEGATDGAGCTLAGTSGICRLGVCTFVGCGNTFVDPGEACDDGNLIPNDGCSADCTSREVCGDGIVDRSLGETCDCGETIAAASCAMPNADISGAECRTTCTPARCGDGITDHEEHCDDGNLTFGDGCRGDCQGRFVKQGVPTNQVFSAVWTGGPSVAFAVGSANVARYDGVAWSLVPTLMAETSFLSVWGSGASDVYVGSNQGLFHYDGVALAKLDPGVVGTANLVGAIFGFGPDDVYIGGVGTTLRHFDGVTWADLSGSCDLREIYAIWGSSPTNLFVAGLSNYCHLGSSGWRSFGVGGIVAMTGSATETFALTGLGEVMRLDPTGTGRGVGLPQPAAVTRGIFASDANELLAVGDTGLILGFDGTSWRPFVSPTEQRLGAIHGTDRRNVFVIGEAGIILH